MKKKFFVFAFILISPLLLAFAKRFGGARWRPARRLWLILLLAVGGDGGEVFCQKILKDTMLHVVKSFQPTIADAYKINDMPLVKDSVPPAPQLSYSINPKKISTPFNVEAIKPAKMVGEPLTKLYTTLIKIGAGNYTTPYAEIFYNNLRSKEGSYGAHLKHFSSKSTLEGNGFSGFSDNQIGLYGKKFLRKSTLSGNLDYNRNVIHYYGYDTSLLDIINSNYTRQRYSTIGGNAALQSHHTDSTHINYLVNLKYYNLSDYYKNSENNINVIGDLSGYYEKQLVHIPVSIDYYHTRAKDTANEINIGLNPYINSSGKKWNARIGIGLQLEKILMRRSARFLFYPNIDFNYNVFENIIIPYVGVTGGFKKNSLKTLTDENPFLVPGPNISNTSEKWKAYGGLRGSISKTISYNTSTSFGKSDNIPLFINDNTDTLIKGFNMLYDHGSLWNIHGELQYQHTEKIKIIAKGDYNKYEMEGEIKPWHKPLWEGSILVNYNLKNKISVTADLFLHGKRYAKVLQNDSLVSVFTTKELKNVVDMNLGLEYRYTKKLSAFLHLNNLGFQRYMLWNNYPVHRLNFLMGITLAL